MEYQITSQPNWHTVVHFSIDAEKIAPELHSKYEEYQKKARLEGFRRGKVPPSLLKKMFGKSIESEVFNRHIHEASKKLFDEHSFDVINTPVVKDLRYDDQTGLQFDLHFDVRPVFDVVGYEGMPVEKEVYEIGAEDVERVLQNLRERNAMVYTVEGEAKVGHYLVVDLQELDLTGVPIVGEKKTEQVLWLSEENAELTPQLLNAKAGEERRIVIRTNEETKGVVAGEKPRREKYYQVKIKEVKERRLPALDDEFAKDIGSYQTLAELRQDLEKRIREQAELESRLRFQEALVDELVKRMPLEVPPTMLEAYLDAVIKDMRKNRKEKIDEEQVRAYYRPLAIRALKWNLIRDRLLEQLNLGVADEEVETNLTEMATRGEAGQKRAEAIRRDKKARERFREELEDEKIYAFLAQHAEVREIRKPWRPEKNHHQQEGEEV